MDNEKLVAVLMGTFLEELEEHVRTINENLLAMEKSGERGDRASRIQALFRAAHSLKGAARAVNIITLESVCHRLEEMLAGPNDSQVDLDAATIGLLYEAADAIQDAGVRLRAGQSLVGSPAELILPRIGVAAPGSDKAKPGPGVAVPGAPPPSVVRPPAAAPGTGAAGDSSESSNDHVRVSAGKMDSLMNRSGELLVASRSLDARRTQVEDLQRLVSRWLLDWRGAVASGLFRDDAGDMNDTGLRIRGIRQAEGDRIRKLSRELGLLSAALASDQRAMDLAVRRVDEEAKAIRMLPFVQVFQRLERAVRDLAQAAGKEVDVVMEGGEVEMDRAILDGLRDPLLQVARNALDHGIELPADRHAAGKPARGRITFSAGLRGAYVEITVADDGQGLDMEAIRSRAVSMGLPPPANDRDLARLIFLPGFTTKRQVTEISGRGVGLDIARAQLEIMHGSFEVASTAGHGCRFTLEVPQTLTTVRALLITAGGMTFAIPLSGVRRLIRADPSEFRQIEGRQMLMVDGSAVNVGILADLLGMGSTEHRRGSGKVPMVVLESSGRLMAVVVEELLAEREILVKNPGARLGHLKLILGVTVLPDGGTALILSPGELVRQGSTARGTLVVDPEIASKRRKRLLVADDSLTIRSLEKSILEGAGFEVVTVQDGVEAMASLKTGGADLLVSDCEMPRMDGFELTRAVRSSQQFQHLPVILLTGLESDANKARGLDAGADAYLLKSGFDQKMLIETIRQLL